MKVSLVVPAYNEEEVIELFATAALAAMEPGWELLIVDDGSTDATPGILRRLAGGDPRVGVVTHDRNRGMGAALATGFRQASGDVIVTMDADLSHPFELVPRLVSACTRADAAYGSRYVPGGGMEGIPWKRAAVSRVANLGLRVVFGTHVRDLTTGFRAYRAEAVRGLPLAGTGFETQLEISVRLAAAGRRIAELPLVLAGRAAGASKMRYAKLVPRYGRMVLRLLAVRWGPQPGD